MSGRANNDQNSDASSFSEGPPPSRDVNSPDSLDLATVSPDSDDSSSESEDHLTPSAGLRRGNFALQRAFTRNRIRTPTSEVEDEFFDAEGGRSRSGGGRSSGNSSRRSRELTPIEDEFFDAEGGRSRSGGGRSSGNSSRRSRELTPIEDEFFDASSVHSQSRSDGRRSAQSNSRRSRQMTPPFRMFRNEEVVDHVQVDEEEDDEGEDLFGDNMERDYRAMPHQDRYDPEMLDDDMANISDLSIGARMEAEAEMRHRDRASGNQVNRLRRGLVFDDDDEDEPRRWRRKESKDDSGDTTAEADKDPTGLESIENLEDTRGMLVSEWVKMPATSNEILNRFKHFLRTYTDATGSQPYRERIRKMVQDNRGSIEVCYTELAKGEQTIAFFLPEAPTEILAILDKGYKQVLLSLYPNFENVTPDLNVRISNLPLQENIRTLRQLHLNQMVRIPGVVSSSSAVMPQLYILYFNCVKCSFVVGPFTQTLECEVTPKVCPDCQGNGPFSLIVEKTIYKDFQRLVIQESPGKVPAGRLPRSKDVICQGDLTDMCKPGDEVEVTGIYTYSYSGSLNVKQGFPVFGSLILANHIYKKENKAAVDHLTDSDIRTIIALSKDVRIADRIVASMAPSIYGHYDIKRGLALALFGGEEKNPGNKHRIRGDINVLLCGDPGTGKSQFLKFVEKLSSRAVFTTGQGASAVGLTAYVQRSLITKEWTIEAGALVLADRGVCLIDEFDKMSDADRTSIHEAMEQQSISIAKAGIVTSLHARCSIMAAANPKSVQKGVYDPTVTFAENVDLSEPILSRFDILCVVQDIPDADTDEMLAKFVINSHIRHHPNNKKKDEEQDTESDQPTPTAFNMFPGTPSSETPAVEELKEDDVSEYANVEKIPQDLLRKYISYARSKIHPKLYSSHVDEERMTHLYSELRRESMNTGCIPITVRHIESLIRLAEAHAKMHLREVVIEDDVNMAVRVMLESFIGSQKFSEKKIMMKQFDRYLRFKKDNNELLYFILTQMSREKAAYLKSRYRSQHYTIEIIEKDFIDKAREINVQNVQQFYKSDIFVKNHYTYDHKRKLILQIYEPVPLEAQNR